MEERRRAEDRRSMDRLERTVDTLTQTTNTLAQTQAVHAQMLKDSAEWRKDHLGDHDEAADAFSKLNETVKAGQTSFRTIMLVFGLMPTVLAIIALYRTLSGGN